MSHTNYTTFMKTMARNCVSKPNLISRKQTPELNFVAQNIVCLRTKIKYRCESLIKFIHELNTSFYYSTDVKRCKDAYLSLRNCIHFLIILSLQNRDSEDFILICGLISIIVWVTDHFQIPSLSSTLCGRMQRHPARKMQGLLGWPGF